LRKRNVVLVAISAALLSAVAMVANVAGANIGPVQPNGGVGTPIPKVSTVTPHAVASPTGTSAPDCGLCWYPLVSPVHTTAVMNIADVTSFVCDATGGHCARLHVVAQEQDSADGSTRQARSFSSITCTDAHGDHACASISGSTWINCDDRGVDCGVDGAVYKCGARWSKPTCPSVVNLASPWLLGKFFTVQISAAGAFAFTTGATGGGEPGISGVTQTFQF
jgi:hypothetical protein